MRQAPPCPVGRMDGWAGSATCRRYSGVKGEGWGVRKGGVKPTCFSPMLRMRRGRRPVCAGKRPAQDFSEGPGARVGGMADRRCRSGALASAAPGWRG